MAFLDEKGDLVLSYEGEKDVAGFREAGIRVSRFLAARRRAASEKSVGALVELLAAEAAVKEISDDEILKRIQKLGKLSEADARAIDPVLMDVEMRRVIRTIVPGGQVTSMDPAKRYFKFKGAGLKKGTPDWEKASRECITFWRAGRRPADAQSLKMFLVLACEAALFDGEKALPDLLRILDEMAPLARTDADMRPAMEKWRAAADALGVKQVR